MILPSLFLGRLRPHQTNSFQFISFPNIKLCSSLLSSASDSSLPVSREKKKIVIEEKDVEEKFVRGSGNGGQKINTTANRVQLTHLPTGIQVSCQEARDLSTNRKIARKLLIDKLDLLFNGADSKLGKAQEKIRKRKRNAKRSFL